MCRACICATIIFISAESRKAKVQIVEITHTHRHIQIHFPNFSIRWVFFSSPARFHSSELLISITEQRIHWSLRRCVRMCSCAFNLLSMCFFYLIIASELSSIQWASRWSPMASDTKWITHGRKGTHTSTLWEKKRWNREEKERNDAHNTTISEYEISSEADRKESNKDRDRMHEQRAMERKSTSEMRKK